MVTPALKQSKRSGVCAFHNLGMLLAVGRGAGSYTRPLISST